MKLILSAEEFVKLDWEHAGDDVRLALITKGGTIERKEIVDQNTGKLASVEYDIKLDE